MSPEVPVNITHKRVPNAFPNHLTLHDPCLQLAFAKVEEVPQPKSLVPFLPLVHVLLDLPEDGALIQSVTF
jgi:hypothetical protein